MLYLFYTTLHTISPREPQSRDMQSKSCTAAVVFTSNHRCCHRMTPSPVALLALETNNGGGGGGRAGLDYQKKSSAKCPSPSCHAQRERENNMQVVKNKNQQAGEQAQQKVSITR
jgi:hypothetical protein